MKIVHYHMGPDVGLRDHALGEPVLNGPVCVPATMQLRLPLSAPRVLVSTVIEAMIKTVHREPQCCARERVQVTGPQLGWKHQ